MQLVRDGSIPPIAPAHKSFPLMPETHFYPRIKYLKGMGDDLLLTGIIFTTDLNRKDDSSP